MSKKVHEPMPRYMVEVANAISNNLGERYQGAWNFAYAYDALEDAEAMANRMAEDNEFVRVIDRTPAELNEESN